MTAQQTHERNLAWIDRAIRIAESDIKSGNGIGTMTEETCLASLRANRKVLERHGPDKRYSNDPPLCGACCEDTNDPEWDSDSLQRVDYPRPTADLIISGVL